MQPILIISFVILSFIAKGSSLTDTAGIHIQNYQELLIRSNNIDSLNRAFSDLYKKYETLNSALQFQEEQIRIMTEGNRNNQLDQIASRKMRIIATAEYISMVNDRLNNLEAFLTISTFQKDVTELNNANNTDLGFSLSTEINRLLEAKILKGKKKVNNIPKEKYLEIVSNVIKSPLTNIALSALPVANSIRSVVDIVLNASLHGSDIRLEDINDFKNDLSKYLHHYEGLSNANKEFSNAIASIQNRQGALNSLILDFSKERVGILFPELKIDTIRSTDLSSKKNILQK